MAMKKILWMRIVPFLCVFLAVQARLVALPQEPPKEAKAQPAGWTPAEMMKVKSVGDVRVSPDGRRVVRSEEHTSELQSLAYLVCRLLLEKKKRQKTALMLEHPPA